MSPFSKLLQSKTFRKSIGLTMLLYLSPVVGLLSEIIFIRIFGIGYVMDVFRSSMTFMLLGHGAIAGQLLQNAVIPQLAVFRGAKQDREGLLFTFYFIIIIFALISPAMFVGLIRPDMLMGYLAPGFPDEVVHEAMNLMRLATIGFMTLVLIGGMSAIANFYGVFWGQPFGQMLLNLVLLLGLLIFGPEALTMAQQLHILEWVLALGLGLGLAIMTVLTVKIWRSTERAPLSMDFGQIVRLSVLLLIPQLVVLGTEICKPLWVNRALSHLDPGAISIFNFAFRLLMLGHLPSMALATILFPHISKIKISGNAGELKRQIAQGSLVIFLLSGGLTILLALTAPLWMDILVMAAQMNMKARGQLIEVYRLLVIVTPAGALSLFYMNALFACRLRRVIMFYSVATIAFLALMLNVTESSGIHGVALSVVLMTYLGAILMAAGLWFNLRKNNKTLEIQDDGVGAQGPSGGAPGL